MTTPIPVTLLTGFLGAGKTTVLNRLLAARAGERIAIVENEFGAVSIDSDLIAPQAVTVVELANGCICCSVRGELSAALAGLLAQQDRGELRFERLLIETTGLADPGPVVQTFFWDEALRERFRLDGVITLIDVCHAARQLDEEPVAAAQVAYADWLILTKTDLAPSAQLPDRLRRINARAEILDVGEIDQHWARLLDTGAFSLNERGVAPSLWTQTTRRAQPAHVASTGHSWDDAIRSLVLRQPGALDLAAISAFVDRLIEEHANDLLRYKGILAIAGEERRLIFQGVHRIAGFDYGRPWADDELRESRIVLIGRDLAEDALRADFSATRATI
jgi:G3E family GTPase